MEKKHTIVHFLTAIMFIIFAVAMLNIANGTATTDRFRNPDGSYDYGPVLAVFIPFVLVIVGLAGLITVLQEGEFTAWLGALGAIAVISLVGFIFNFMQISALLIGGIYALWWTISAIRHLAAHWDSFYWENKLLIVCRLLIAAALIVSVLMWITLPVEFDIVQDMTQVIPFCGWAGGLSIAAAVALVVEAFCWIKYADY